MDFLGIERRNKQNRELRELITYGVIPSEYIEELFSVESKSPVKAKIMFGNLQHKEKGVETNETSKMWDYSRYKYLVFAPFDVSNKCCDVMKKDPVHRYGKETGRKAITGEQASESRLRTQKWLQNGCNGFDLKIPKSTPMAFWTEQDILLYIKINNLPICSVYGDVVEDNEIKGQQTIFDYEEVVTKELFESERPILTTTGCDRTGCMFCGYGCHLEKTGQGRFERMKETHPKVYEWIMKPWENGGLNYKEIIDWLNEHGNLNIRY